MSKGKSCNFTVIHRSIILYYTVILREVFLNFCCFQSLSKEKFNLSDFISATDLESLLPLADHSLLNGTLQITTVKFHRSQQLLLSIGSISNVT